MGCAASGTKEPSPPHDEAKQHEKYEEDPDEPLPEGEIGDCMLGVNVSNEICSSIFLMFIFFCEEICEKYQATFLFLHCHNI